jgi:hypothetical protein
LEQLQDDVHKRGKEKLVIKTPDEEISTTLSARKKRERGKSARELCRMGFSEVRRGMGRLKRFCVTFKQPTAEIKFQLETEKKSFPLS